MGTHDVHAERCESAEGLIGGLGFPFEHALDAMTGVRRPGHRRGWIAEALAPARADMDAGTFKKLSDSVTLLPVT
jgi:hypothetical protein